MGEGLQRAAAAARATQQGSIIRGEDADGRKGWLIVGVDVGVFKTKRDAQEFIDVVLKGKEAVDAD